MKEGKYLEMNRSMGNDRAHCWNQPVGHAGPSPDSPSTISNFSSLPVLPPRPSATSVISPPPPSFVSGCVPDVLACGERLPLPPPAQLTADLSAGRNPRPSWTPLSPLLFSLPPQREPDCMGLGQILSGKYSRGSAAAFHSWRRTSIGIKARVFLSGTPKFRSFFFGREQCKKGEGLGHQFLRLTCLIDLAILTSLSFGEVPHLQSRVVGRARWEGGAEELEVPGSGCRRPWRRGSGSWSCGIGWTGRWRCPTSRRRPRSGRW